MIENAFEIIPKHKSYLYNYEAGRYEFISNALKKKVCSG